MLCTNAIFLVLFVFCRLFGPAYSTVFLWRMGMCLCLFGCHFWDNYACARDGFKTKSTGTARESVNTNINLGTVPRLPMPRLAPRGCLGTPDILGTGATFHLGQLHLHVENLECRAQKWSARCQKCAMPCRFFSVCKWGSKPVNLAALKIESLVAHKNNFYPLMCLPELRVAPC